MTELLDTRVITAGEVFSAIKDRLREGWIQGANGDWAQPKFLTPKTHKGPVCLYGAYMAVTNENGDSFIGHLSGDFRERIWNWINEVVVAEHVKYGGADDYDVEADDGVQFNDYVAHRVEEVIDLVGKASARRGSEVVGRRVGS